MEPIQKGKIQTAESFMSDINWDDRPSDDKEIIIDSQKYRDRSSARSHFQKIFSLLLMFLGFFFCIGFDLFLVSSGKESWVTDRFIESLVPVFAFIIGYSIKNN